jgi:hypothetical protein
MPVARAALAAVALGLLTAAGCGPKSLNEKKSYSLDVGVEQALELDPQRKPQTITVEFTSSAADVSVYVVPPDARGATADDPPKKDKALGMKTGRQGSFSVELPEKTAAVVLVRDAKAKTDVTLKVTNAK